MVSLCGCHSCPQESLNKEEGVDGRHCPALLAMLAEEMGVEPGQVRRPPCHLATMYLTPCP